MYITYESSYYYSGKLYFFAREFNALLSIDLKKQKLSYVTSVADIEFSARYSFTAISGIRNEIILAPREAEKIVVYDINTGRICEYKLRKFSGYPINFQEIAHAGEKLYLIGCQYPAVIQVNPETMEQVYFDEWKDKIKCTPCTFFHRGCSVVQGEYIYLACAFSNQILTISTKTGKSVFLPVGKDNDCFSGMCFDGTYFWLAPYYGNVLLRWNHETGKSERILLPERNKVRGISYCGCRIWKEYVLVFPTGENPFCVISWKSLEMHTFSIEEICGSYMEYSSKDLYPITSMSILECGDCLLQIYPGNHYVLKEGGGGLSFTPFHIDETELHIENILRMWMRENKKSLMAIENKVLTLPVYLSLLPVLEQNRNKSETMLGKSKIWRSICRG